MKKRIISLFAAFMLCGALVGCGAGETGQVEENQIVEDQKEIATLNIAYQYGSAYSPLAIAMEKKFIEEEYKQATGQDVTITWTQMPKGADINTGIASGQLDAGFMGTAPAVTGCLKGAGYKIFTNLSGQEHAMHTNHSEIASLSDLVGGSNQIALVNNGSIQHIILAMSLAENGMDPHALDSNIVAMAHPDGLVALQSGSVACHLTSSPYIYTEREDESLTEILEIANTWSVENSFIVGVASESLYNDNPKLYDALCKGIADAIDFVNNNTEETAKITCVVNGTSESDELFYLQSGNYSAETKNLLDVATFMVENGFVEASSVTMDQLVFPNVKGN
ncbi:MAG: ABC transporter substrate-binding protein [Eubacteriales bacterium]|nr:ABC transporter substrate-binding protein [Eubacteriales bacterium]